MNENHDVLSRADSLMRPEGEKPFGLSPLGGRPEGAATQIRATEGQSPLGESPLGTRRRRSFVAAIQPAPEVETTVAAMAPSSEDDDFPLLTEVVPPETAVPVPPADHFDETLVAILASDIAHAIEQQLAIELPTLIEASLLTAKEELQAGISATMEVALRDFLARRRQLRLPLDESGSGH